MEELAALLPPAEESAPGQLSWAALEEELDEFFKELSEVTEDSPSTRQVLDTVAKRHGTTSW